MTTNSEDKFARNLLTKDPAMSVDRSIDDHAESIASWEDSVIHYTGVLHVSDSSFTNPHHSPCRSVGSFSIWSKSTAGVPGGEVTQEALYRSRACTEGAVILRRVVSLNFEGSPLLHHHALLRLTPGTFEYA